MGRGYQGAVLKALGVRDHTLEVVAVEDVTAHYRRLRLRSSTLFDDLDPGPTAFVRLWVPDPEEAGREHQRCYTVLDADPASGEVTLEFVLHEPHGPASAWAAAAIPGSTVRAAAWASKKFLTPDPAPAGYLLVGDPAATPALNDVIATVPAHTPIELYLEWSHDADADIPVAAHPRLRVHRVRRNGPALAAAIETRDWSDWCAWVAGERRTVRHVREVLQDVHGFPRSEVTAQAYWIEGKSLGASRSPQPSEPVAVPVAGPETTGGRQTWRSQAGRELLRPLRRTLLLAALVQALVTVGQLVPFVLLVDVARDLLGGATVDELWPRARVALWVLGGAATVASALLLWLHLVDARFGTEVRGQLLAKLARLPLGWFTERSSGAVKSLVQDDTARLHYYVTHAVLDVVSAVVAPLVVLVYLLVVDARLALALMVPLVVYGFLFSSMVRESGSKIAQVGAWGQRMNSEAVAFMDALPVVRTFGGTAASRFRSTVEDYVGFLDGWQRPFIGRRTVVGLVTRPATFLWIVVAAGAPMVIAGTLSPYDLLPFLLVGPSFGPRLVGIAYGAGSLKEGTEAAQRIGLTLAEPELAVAAPEALEPSEPREPAVPAVELRSVTFGYRPDQPVVRDVDLRLAPGTLTALVGPSGAGKSTLAALIARFHDVDQGTITIGGTDIRRLAPDELYRQVGFVFQDVQLLRGSVRDNIALARPDASDDAVAAAARAAQIHEAIDGLPRGYDSVLGSDAFFSTGEAQRVTVARALLADAPVLVLDEATAFADPDAEHEVQQALSRLMAGRTVLVVAHRLRTVVDADRIVVLDGGRIVEQGRHGELLAREGRYAALWSASGAAPIAGAIPEAAR